MAGHENPGDSDRTVRAGPWLLVLWSCQWIPERGQHRGRVFCKYKRKEKKKDIVSLEASLS